MRLPNRHAIGTVWRWTLHPPDNIPGENMVWSSLLIVFVHREHTLKQLSVKALFDIPKDEIAVNLYIHRGLRCGSPKKEAVVLAACTNTPIRARGSGEDNLYRIPSDTFRIPIRAFGYLSGGKRNQWDTFQTAFRYLSDSGIRKVSDPNLEGRHGLPDSFRILAGYYRI